MGNFEKAIPKTLRALELEMGAKRREIWAIEAKYLHDCDCEYCTEQSDVLPEEQEEIIAGINQEIDDTEAMINRLKRHAVVHKVKLFTPKVRKLVQ